MTTVTELNTTNSNNSVNAETKIMDSKSVLASNLFAPENENSSSSIIKSNENQHQQIQTHYKIDNRHWLNPSDEDFLYLCNYISEQIAKGHGEAYIYVGQSNDLNKSNNLNDDEEQLAQKTLLAIKKKLNVSIITLKENNNKNNNQNNKTSIQNITYSQAENKDETINNNKETIGIGEANQQQQQQQLSPPPPVKGGSINFSKSILVRKNYDDLDDFMEVRVAVVGNVDAGKSTLLGVLTHGVLDDGRGEARTKLFRHKHEIESGRTSSVGNDILGFNSEGLEINELKKSLAAHASNKSLDWEDICRRSTKVITFIDLAGHEKYLKTTVFGMTGHSPDYAMLMVGSNMGVVGMTKEHLGLSLALNIPVFVVVTKIDMCPANVLQETLKTLQKILRSPGCRKLAYIVENRDDVIDCANNFTSERLCPIFQVSNVTGQNLDLLKLFLNLLSTRMESNLNDPAEFQVDDIYSVPGVGTVVSGICFKGRIQVNDSLLLGPDLIGQFRPILIKGIHRKRLPVKECLGGQTASFALKKLKRSEIRKGMYILSDKLNPVATWTFEAEVLILHHPTTISINYQAMVHCGSIRQTATIIKMSVEHMRTGDKALVRFQFIKNPEYLRPGIKMVFREGRTKAIGTISRVNLKKDDLT